MSILLAIVTMSIKYLFPYDFGPAILCHMSLHVALVTISFTLRYVLLIDPPTLANIGSMSFLVTVMTSGLGILTFVNPLLNAL